MVRFTPAVLNFRCSRLAIAVDAFPVIKLYSSPFLKWVSIIWLFMQLLKNTTLFGFSKKVLRNFATANELSFGRMLIAVVILLVFACYAGLLVLYTRQWKKLNDYTPSAPPSVKVSVVIAARNEEKTLPPLLHDLKQQDFPAFLFEVIIVNDFSTDGTAAIAQHLPPNFRMLMPVSTAEQSSKKKAIATGIAAATGELILVTDADCRIGKSWISTMASFYAQTGASFIAAPVKYTYQPSLLQVLQVLDFITLQGITAASVSANFGTMCNGANLAYTKAAFESVNGFAGIDSVPTGDDMLLMYKIWKVAPEKVFYLKSNEAIVTTAPMLTWRAFYQQRRRWASKTMVYDDKRLILVLAFVLLLNLLPCILLAAAFFNPVFLLYSFFCLLAKTLIEWPFVFSVAKFFGEQKLMRYFFFLQPLHVFYTVFVGIWSQVGGYEWKGRKAPPPPKGGLAGTQSSLKQDARYNTASSTGEVSAPATPPLGGGGAAG